MPFVWLSRTLRSVVTRDVTPGLPRLQFGLRQTVLCDVSYELRLKKECLCLGECVYSARYGYAMSQAVSRWPLTAEA